MPYKVLSACITMNGLQSHLQMSTQTIFSLAAQMANLIFDNWSFTYMFFATVPVAKNKISHAKLENL